MSDTQPHAVDGATPPSPNAAPYPHSGPNPHAAPSPHASPRPRSRPNPNTDPASPHSQTASPHAGPASLEELAARVAQLDAEMTALRQDTGGAGGDTGGQPPLYDNVEQWVRDWLLVTIDRPLGETGGQWRWCEQWWAHNEAVLALTALWYAWEHARLQQTGMLAWLREAHYHLQILCSADGPLRECAPTHHDHQARHTTSDFPPVAAAPPGWFDWWGQETPAG